MKRDSSYHGQTRGSILSKNWTEGMLDICHTMTTICENHKFRVKKQFWEKQLKISQRSRNNFKIPFKMLDNLLLT